MGRGMYALPSRPNKIVANVRIGPSKTLNNLEIARETEKQSPTELATGMSSPKPVFNGRQARLHHPQRQNSNPQQSQYSAQHEDIVRYLSDAWNRVSLELSKHQGEAGGPIVYREKNPNPRLNDFKPFDLEQYWGERYMQQVTGSSS